MQMYTGTTQNAVIILIIIVGIYFGYICYLASESQDIPVVFFVSYEINFLRHSWTLTA